MTSLRLAILSSGSKANSIFLKCADTRILIDAGLGIRNLIFALETLHERVDRLDAIFITHEHTDHVRGLARLLPKCRATLYASAGTLTCLDTMIPTRIKTVSMGHDEFEVGPLAVRAIPIPHDAAEPLAYTFLSGTTRVTIATDLGEVPRDVATALEHSTIAVFESNHDVEMLRVGSYPEDLKRRILSRHGHLSNEQSAAALAACRGNGLEHVVLAHISAENNDPALALRTALNALDGTPTRVHLTRQMTVGPVIDI
jgi:phosphoribosyl 1,2-cyclic phosphodiesterase